MTITNERRPQAGNPRATEAFRGATQSLPSMSVNGRIRLKLWRCNPDESTRYFDREDISALKRLTFAPAGAEVIIEVDPGQVLPNEGIQYVRERGGHLGPIYIECDDPQTVQTWVRAFRGEGDQWS